MRTLAYSRTGNSETLIKLPGTLGTCLELGRRRNDIIEIEIDSSETVSNAFGISKNTLGTFMLSVPIKGDII